MTSVSEEMAQTPLSDMTSVSSLGSAALAREALGVQTASTFAFRFVTPKSRESVSSLPDSVTYHYVF